MRASDQSVQCAATLVRGARGLGFFHGKENEIGIGIWESLVRNSTTCDDVSIDVDIDIEARTNGLSHRFCSVVTQDSLFTRCPVSPTRKRKRPQKPGFRFAFTIHPKEMSRILRPHASRRRTLQCRSIGRLDEIMRQESFVFPFTQTMFFFKPLLCTFICVFLLAF
jgi:hypothetical protein